MQSPTRRHETSSCRVCVACPLYHQIRRPKRPLGGMSTIRTAVSIAGQTVIATVFSMRRAAKVKTRTRTYPWAFDDLIVLEVCHGAGGSSDLVEHGGIQITGRRASKGEQLERRLFFSGLGTTSR